MKLETVMWVMTLVVVTSAQSYYGQGSEYGRLRGRLQNNGFDRGLQSQAQNRRDANSFDGLANQRARWAGQSALRDNSQVQNQGASQRNAQSANQDFGRFGSNIADLAKQIKSEALRHQYVIKDDAKYRRNNHNSAEGGNQAKAKKTAFKKVNEIDDDINYAFSKKYDKASSENGGSEEENSRNFKKLDLVDEREKDLKRLRGDSELSRKQSDLQKAEKNQASQSNAKQNQAQDGKYGFQDKRVDQAGERSDDRAVDYDKTDSKYSEQESGKEEAVRLAKELAQQHAGYNNQAKTNAGASRNINDKKVYGGSELGANSVGAAQDGYGPENAAQAGSALSGNKARQESSGGAIQSGFGENASQHERANEQASAKAQSSAQAVNDYQRNKDKVAYNQRTGLQDRSTGQFKQGLKDSTAQGFSGNSAEAAKSAASSDKNNAASQSASNLEAKEKNDKEALRDRQYFRKIQKDDSETFSHRKQFYHNKKEGGNNDEKLKYNRKKNERNLGAADEAELAKQNNFRNLHEDGKVSSQVRDFEDLVDRSNRQQQARQNRQGAARSFLTKDSQQAAQAQAAANAAEKSLSKSSKDDSQSSAFNRQQGLQDQSDNQQRAKQSSSDKAHDVALDVEYLRPSNTAPLGDLRAKNFIDPDLLRAQTRDKGPKEHNIPDTVINIQPLPAPPKVEAPRQPQPVPPLPEVQQVKSYHPPKHGKAEVSYDTRRGSNLGAFSSQPRFSRINPTSFFSGPRRSSLNSQHQQSQPQSRFSFQRLGARPSGSRFGTSLFGNTFGRRRW
ncbi:hypothetical protein ACOMHN_028225 [Nucella lapillus]